MKYDLNGTLEMYVKYQESNGLDKNKTINKYMTCIEEFLNEMNITTLEQIQELNWIEVKVNYVNKLKNERGLSAQSINLRLTSIQSYFNVLEGLDILEKNIIKNIKKEVEKVDDDLVTYYTYDEAVLTHEEYEEYCSLLNDPGIQKLEEDNLILMNANAEGYETSEQNNLIIMEAIADLYELLNKLTEVQ